MPEKKDSFLAKLDELEARYSEIEKQIAEPAVACDSARLIALSKEQGKLKNIVTRYREYKTTVAGIKDAEQILKDRTVDEDFRALAKEEIRHKLYQSGPIFQKAGKWGPQKDQKRPATIAGFPGIIAFSI